MFSRRLFKRVSATKPVVDGCNLALRDAESAHSSRGSHLDPVERHGDIKRCVVVLSVPCGPPTVAGLIVTRWVDAIQCVSLWAWTHVIKERDEAVAPALTNVRAFAAIEAVVAAARRVASALHRAKDRVLTWVRVLGDADCRVLWIASRPVFALFAAARTRIATEQVFAVLHGLRAAVASASPVCALAGMWGSSENDETPETLAGQVFGVVSHLYVIRTAAPFVYRSLPCR